MLEEDYIFRNLPNFDTIILCAKKLGRRIRAMEEVACRLLNLKERQVG
jgi:hypothetical protein